MTMIDLSMRLSIRSGRVEFLTALSLHALTAAACSSDSGSGPSLSEDVTPSTPAASVPTSPPVLAAAATAIVTSSDTLGSSATPGQAAEVHADILARAESAISDLGLAYRILDLCAGDLGASSARTFDIEVYAPGADQWLEVSSVSWFTDYQARRANVRYRPEGQKGTAVVHTLNGSGLAVPRVWAAVVETHRQADGTIAVPEPLLPYFRGATVIS